MRPQDDLYRHVNGTWLRDYQLPPDKASVGAITDANDRTLDQLRAIIEGIRVLFLGRGVVVPLVQRRQIHR
ncbi:hypothetical protein [Nocardia sp. NPDC060259]|uniref:hypothetical protein n=1 Tax=Nocardia sp. NPDC060259 TaxID=3347088 RepID=UPI0036684F2E